ncbi:MAG: acyltransferase [Magnetococcales bacterium]|nr:acyltransferase [Magnetococcales bacterium]
MYQLFIRLFEFSSVKAGWSRALEGMRGLAAIAVFFVHYRDQITDWLPEDSITRMVAEVLGFLGHTGVDFFFLLSGYLLYGIAINPHFLALPYFKRRFIRIYPTYMVVFPLYLLLYYLVPTDKVVPTEMGPYLTFFLANMTLAPPFIYADDLFITVAWSLRLEVMFYVLLPLTVFLFRLRERGRAQRLLIFVGVWFAILFFMPEQLRASMFVFGMVLWEYQKGGELAVSTRGLNGLALLLLAVTYGLMVGVRLEGIPWEPWREVAHYCLFVSAFTLAAAAMRGEGWLADFFSWRPLCWVGNFSYSFFLTHGLTIKAFFVVLAWFFPHAQPVASSWYWLLLPPVFLLCCLVSALLFLLVERPLSLDGRGIALLWGRS